MPEILQGRKNDKRTWYCKSNMTTGNLGKNHISSLSPSACSRWNARRKYRGQVDRYFCASGAGKASSPPPLPPALISRQLRPLSSLDALCDACIPLLKSLRRKNVSSQVLLYTTLLKEVDRGEASVKSPPGGYATYVSPAVAVSHLVQRQDVSGFAA